MGKRKSKNSYENIKRKIKKLESKLKKRRRISSSSSPSSDQSFVKEYYDTNEQDSTEFPGEEVSENVIDIYDDSPVAEETVAGPYAQAPPVGPSASSAPDCAALPAMSSDTQILVIEDNTGLDPEILKLLGVDPTDQKIYGEDLHKDIATRWTHILANGLPKDTLTELTKCYLPPNNCPNMRAPKLNLEVKAALLEINIKKYLFSQNKQNQLSSSLAAIGQVLNWALSAKSTVPQDIIKCLSDAGRLICDNHFRESQSRRFAALSTLNKDIRDTVKNTIIDEHLFGSALSEHIKSSKAITRTGSEIKQKSQRPVYRGPAVVTHPRGALNSTGAPLRVTPAVEQRSTPVLRRPPRDRRMEAPRGRRPANNARQQPRRRY